MMLSNEVVKIMLMEINGRTSLCISCLAVLYLCALYLGLLRTICWDAAWLYRLSSFLPMLIVCTYTIYMCMFGIIYG